MKANEFELESILSAINPDDWGIAWEAISNATSRGIDFEKTAHVVTFVKKYIWVTKYNEDIYTRRTRVKDSEGNTRTQIQYIVKFCVAEEVTDRHGNKTDSVSMWENMQRDEVTPEEIAIGHEQQKELVKMLQDMGFSNETVELLMEGGRIAETAKGITRKSVRAIDMKNKQEVNALRKLRAIYAQ